MKVYSFVLQFSGSLVAPKWLMPISSWAPPPCGYLQWLPPNAFPILFILSAPKIFHFLPRVSARCMFLFGLSVIVCCLGFFVFFLKKIKASIQSKIILYVIGSLCWTLNRFSWAQCSQRARWWGWCRSLWSFIHYNPWIKKRKEGSERPWRKKSLKREGELRLWGGSDCWKFGPLRAVAAAWKGCKSH